MSGGRHYYSLVAKPLAVGFPRLVGAYKVGEGVAQAVPAEVVEWQNACEDLALVLVSGRYALVLQDA